MAQEKFKNNLFCHSREDGLPGQGNPVFYPYSLTIMDSRLDLDFL